MKYIIISLILYYCLVQDVLAQDLFVKQATVTYEKKVRPEKGFDDPKLAGFLAGLNSTWSLTFSGDITLYKSVATNDEGAMSRALIDKNLKDEFFFDFGGKKRIKKKKIGNEYFLVEDSIPNLKWKLLPDVREIAGYECRKALTKINDTVYVAAFYTDRILARGGPEGFNGLPGMILGLAIPRLKTTWFASKVELKPVDPKMSRESFLGFEMSG
ncbi:GLPGLI family protein [Pedobacter miscanthi]|uniref:GLPGLI family protein n=1 Tax=Pedobacter miscanthi TaxID=2259170 RepID=A0A366L1Q2_9SPHI|nr:GLPGLI family protein [Pedobacter miscanthi]RBQ07831.1 GLPGLI family protein [Pedobacter miscanthi]